MERAIEIGGRRVTFERPRVMGILNVTPDSFYDGGRYTTEVAIRKRVERILEEGADIIDVGGYSTRPGATAVSEREELERLDPVVEMIRRSHPDALISIDTFRSGVAKSISDCFGPIIVNDISGGTMDEGIFDFVAKSGLPYILMHIQGTPDNMQQNPHYEDVVGEVRSFLMERVERLKGLGFDNIILDPGFGFGKSLEHNYELLRRMEELTALGYPLLVGVSRKSMIYKLLGGSPEEALNGTTVLNTIALLKGASVLRVHDVKEAVETVRIFEKFHPLSESL